MQQKFNVGIVTFSYGGNGGISSEVPDIREWMVPLVVEASRDERIDNIRVWNLSDTPITMTRNRAVLQARQMGVDVLLMVDSDMKPDINAGNQDAKPFFQSSFDFLVNHYHKGPCVIGAPYCGPPPVECVYVFRWQNMQSENCNPDFQLEMYDRHTAVKLAGIQECAALPTGLIMYDMRAFALTEPKSADDKPWFYYEWKDHFASDKASTEDVTMTRDLSLVGTQKLGYNPVYCNWDAWAGHWKPKCVGKPQVIDASGVSKKLKDCWEGKHEVGVKLCHLPTPKWLDTARPQGFNNMGMITPPEDLATLRSIVAGWVAEHGQAPQILEVGSWAGASALAMAEAGGLVTCVDHWQGNKGDDGCSQYDCSSGSPYEVFLKNTAAARSKGWIYPHKATSEDAAEYYASKGRKFDIVYIDAEHDSESVKRDIELWKPLAKHILAGHDYLAFPGVRQAVSDTLPGHVHQGNVWHVRL